MSGVGGVRWGRTTETNMAVSFTVYSSTPERGTMQLCSVCWGSPFNPLTAVVYKNTKVTCVFQLVSVNSREAWFGWLKRGSNFFLHFTEAYIIFLLPVKQNVFSTGSLVLVMVKKNKKTKQTKKKKIRVRNKKSSGPKRDDADTATPPPSCRSAGF